MVDGGVVVFEEMFCQQHRPENERTNRGWMQEENKVANKLNQVERSATIVFISDNYSATRSFDEVRGRGMGNC